MVAERGTGLIYRLTNVDLGPVAEGINHVDIDLIFAADNYKPKADLIMAAQDSYTLEV